METRGRQEVYQQFLEIVAQEVQQERTQVNRRVFGVFFWCFLVPAILTVSILILIKFRVLPSFVRGHLDWLLLVSPVAYSIYIISSEVLPRAPDALRRGGMAAHLRQLAKEGQWRDRMTESLERSLSASTEEWAWIVANFQIDLEAFQYRMKYLTILAGAVFFLVLQGVDAFTGEEVPAQFLRGGFWSWFQNVSHGLSEFLGLALFLILLHLSGGQAYFILRKYFYCAQLASKRTNLIQE